MRACQSVRRRSRRCQSRSVEISENGAPASLRSSYPLRCSSRFLSSRPQLRMLDFVTGVPDQFPNGRDPAGTGLLNFPEPDFLGALTYATNVAEGEDFG